MICRETRQDRRQGATGAGGDEPAQAVGSANIESALFVHYSRRVLLSLSHAGCRHAGIRIYSVLGLAVVDRRGLLLARPVGCHLGWPPLLTARISACRAGSVAVGNAMLGHHALVFVQIACRLMLKRLYRQRALSRACFVKFHGRLIRCRGCSRLPTRQA